jgi:hypothetical protein
MRAGAAVLSEAFKSIGLTIVLVFSVVSPADARPDARAMTCAEIQSLLERQRAVTLTTGPHSYGRYVAPGACDGTGLAQPATIAAKDTNQCAVSTCGPRVRRTD